MCAQRRVLSAHSLPWLLIASSLPRLLGWPINSKGRTILLTLPSRGLQSINRLIIHMIIHNSSTKLSKQLDGECLVFVRDSTASGMSQSTMKAVTLQIQPAT
jgi:hypothetical protein